MKTSDPRLRGQPYPSARLRGQPYQALAFAVSRTKRSPSRSAAPSAGPLSSPSAAALAGRLASAALAGRLGSGDEAELPTGPAEHTEAALPIRLDADNGDHCGLRNGGSRDSRPADPDLVGWCSCTNAGPVWAKDQPFDKSGKTWTVRTGNTTGPLTEPKVTTAYYIATAS